MIEISRTLRTTANQVVVWKNQIKHAETTRHCRSLFIDKKKSYLKENTK